MSDLAPHSHTSSSYCSKPVRCFFSRLHLGTGGIHPSVWIMRVYPSPQSTCLASLPPRLREQQNFCSLLKPHLLSGAKFSFSLSGYVQLFQEGSPRFNNLVWEREGRLGLSVEILHDYPNSTGHPTSIGHPTSTGHSPPQAIPPLKSTHLHRPPHLPRPPHLTDHPTSTGCPPPKAVLPLQITPHSFSETQI